MLPVDESLSRRIADGADEGTIIGEIRQRHIPDWSTTPWRNSAPGW